MGSATAARGLRDASAESSLGTLLAAVRELSAARQTTDVQRVVRKAARALAGADGATFVLRDGDKCFYLDEDAISPLWKGQRFPLRACISGWSMLNHSPVAIEDIYSDERIPHEAYRPTFVKSLVMVPIRTNDPLGAIGMYWARRHKASSREIGLAQALADSTALALEHILVLAELKRTITLAETDPLTGVANRRGWDEVLAQAALDARQLCVALIDIDHFKSYNDTRGHQAGDVLLRGAAAAWRSALRDRDVLARVGGDEFAALMPACGGERGLQIAGRLLKVMPPGATASIGLAERNLDESIQSLLARADTALYQAKALGRGCVAAAP